jgi:hypothetical protein
MGMSTTDTTVSDQAARAAVRPLTTCSAARSRRGRVAPSR